MDSETPPPDDHPGETRAPTASTAVAKNACLMLNCVIATSSVYQAHDKHPGRARLIYVNGRHWSVDAMTADSARTI
jgi:hypothetical protein